MVTGKLGTERGDNDSSQEVEQRSASSGSVEAQSISCDIQIRESTNLFLLKRLYHFICVIVRLCPLHTRRSKVPNERNDLKGHYPQSPRASVTSFEVSRARNFEYELNFDGHFNSGFSITAFEMKSQRSRRTHSAA